MHMKTIVYIVVLFSNFLFAQISKEHFENILCPEIYNNDNLLENSIKVIISESKLSPELIYYRVIFLNNIYGNKNIDQQSNGFLDLKNAKTAYILNRNSWLHKQIDYLKTNHAENKYYSIILNFYEDLIINTEAQFSELDKKIDKNLLYFYVMFLYSNGTINIYNKNINYSDKRRAFERDEIKKLQMHNLSSSNNQDAFASFKNKLNIISKSNYNYSDILISQCQKDFSSTNMGRINIGLFYIYSYSKSLNDIEVGIIPEIYNFDNKPMGSIRVANIFGFNLGYKFFIKSEIERFSYINLNIFYQFTSANLVTNSKPETYRKTIKDTRSTKIYEFYDVKKATFEKPTNNMLGIYITTPLIVINPQLTLDFGLTAYYTRTGYKQDALYDTWRVSGYFVRDGVYNYEY